MLELRVLGAVDLSGAGEEAQQLVLRQPKRLALLTYLAIESRRHFARRDSLLAMFWPELDDERARHSLRQALHVLRRGLGRDVFIRRGDDDLSVNRETLACDAAAFEARLDEAQLEPALTLYEGDLLPGVFVDDAPEFGRWLDDTRRRLRERAFAAAASLERAAEARGDLLGAATWVRRALALTPHDESALRRLLTYLDRSGDRASALAAYGRFAQRLAADMEVEPSPETMALSRQLRARVVPNETVPAPTAVSPGSAGTPSAESPAALPSQPAPARHRPRRLLYAVGALLTLLVTGGIVWRSTITASPPAPDTARAGVGAAAHAVSRRLYDEALSAWTREDFVAAERMTLAAYTQDSTFALALFTYGTLLGHRAEFDEGLRVQQRAVAMASRQPDHERLLILTWFAQNYSDPRFPAYAETLAIRYPDDLQAQWFVAQGRRFAGDFLGAIPPLRRVIDIDGHSLRSRTRARCFACRAYPELVNSYENLDSLARAEAVAREWIEAAPTDPEALGLLFYQLGIQGRYREALEVQQRKEDLARTGSDLDARGEILLRAGDFETYEHILLERMSVSAEREKNVVRWSYWFALRYQGRMREALEQVPLMRREVPDEALAGLRTIMRAQSYYETGEFAAAARLWDSMATHVNAREPPGSAARHRTFLRAHLADALAGLRDSSALARLADSMRVDGLRSGYGRDRRLHHHTRGLLSEVRGDFSAACDHFHQALMGQSPAYSRTNIAIGRTCLAANRPRDALKPLYGALHGPIGAAGTYGTMTEVHELLGAVYEALGRADSASYWYGRAASAWKRADPAWLARPERQRGSRRVSSARPTAQDRPARY
jgi:DNA-binding SARP family transcriptional activator